jgi:hypothetical protein
METELSCETSVDFNCMKELAANEILLNFVATNVVEIRLMIIMFVLQFLVPEGRRVSPAA